MSWLILMCCLVLVFFHLLLFCFSIPSFSNFWLTSSFRYISFTCSLCQCLWFHIILFVYWCFPLLLVIFIILFISHLQFHFWQPLQNILILRLFWSVFLLRSNMKSSLFLFSSSLLFICMLIVASFVTCLCYSHKNQDQNALRTKTSSGPKLDVSYCCFKQYILYIINFSLHFL